MDPLFNIPEDFGALDADALQQFIDETTATLGKIGSSPQEFVTAERPFDELKTEVAAAVTAVKAAREQLAKVTAETEEPAVEEPAAEAEVVEEPIAEPEDDPDAEAAAAEIAALANEATEEPEPVTAAASTGRPVRRPPARSRAAAPPVTEEQLAPLVAAAGAMDIPLGSAFENPLQLAESMIRRRHQFGNSMPDGAENVTVAVVDWSEQYPEDRNLRGLNEQEQAVLIAAATDERAIRDRFAQRRKAEGGSLVASGGLCAPVTPYYNLQMISVAERPVRAALPAFNADRGGIRAARPASLAAITTGVGAMTAADDAAGGTSGTKTCQVVDCPDFEETDVEILFHCLRFGNLGARTFPERVAQWNNLVLAAHARLGDRTLLSAIDAASTAVTADTLGLGASADLLSQVIVAAAGMRSRHRMDPEAVLRVMFPFWVQGMIVSDVYRSQFQRWDMTPDKFVALLREANVEPTFYIDSAAGKEQEFPPQTPGDLLPFPGTVSWYLYPEGSFLYLDGGVLELGLVRDSVLNSTNDFEIFGESFENVAFIGVESLAVESTLCDTGITAGTHNPGCPYTYGATS